MSLPYPVSPPMMGDTNAATIPPGDVDNRPSFYPGTTEPMVTMAPAADYPMPYPGGCSGWPQPGYPEQPGYPGYPAAQYPAEQPAQYPGYAPQQPGYPPPPQVMPGYPPQDSPAYPTAASYLQTFPSPRNGFQFQSVHLMSNVKKLGTWEKY